MSQLSYMEKLLDGVEVEWRALRDVVKTITAPAKLKRESYREAGQTPIIDQGEKFITGYTNEDVKALPLGEYVIFGDHSEHIKYVDFSFIQGADGLKILKSISDNPKYVYYSFLNFYQKELNYKRHWARASETLIPIPCPDNPEKSLVIQSEIVRILDKFTALTAELTAELNMRKKQYNYYRDQLLSFEEGDVEWKTLLEVCDYVDYRGKTPQKTASGIFLVTAKNIRMGYIDYEASQEFIDENDYSLVMRRGIPKLGDVLITTEAPCGFVAQVDRENIALAQRVIKYRSKDSRLSNSFLKHYLLGGHFQKKLHSAATGSTVKGIKGSKLHQLTIPIPSEDEQARIVSILDKFDTLTTSIQEGLPREIELRQKQYEYYRDLLLSFPKSSSCEAV
ncbi:restriction endonuclease subunit S [Proteus mirabilis]|uniref:restriction endonuclease subunit S n=1 Tax=Proteus mirabilis TaxID=584 RepID=UPI0018C698F1|nr:restriction endonuclease subunit S [Proteus mirabilis]EKV7658855.1 restriction endonuclease subunit S [Proteus mirabilis]MBG2918452.1 restriction endonuclease subunit S [Proteus mirabilis]MBI6185992.1 restriction endonuclease subunit S [Proteus mirabilis]MBI6534808.1 restriction endonuclease subunit S [Proteus mirabilis]MCT0068825.1 restriction endonuclease subunit S [Proteus mirabilis]